MKNPLNRRLLREFKQDLGKYISLFLFLCLTISFVSGFLVADNSMKIAYDESFDKYQIENGHFALAAEMPSQVKEKLEKEDVKINELFYKDFSVRKDDTLRIYRSRKTVDKTCLMYGDMPQNDSEIVIDRLYAENNDISVGDTIKADGKKFKISGLVAFSDYSALFKNNTDMMFDANRFSTAIVSDEAYDSLSDTNEVYCYVWLNNDTSLNDQQQADKADDIMDILKETGLLTDFVKRSDNQAIVFTGNDMGSDKSMMMMLLYVIVVILAFVFGITIKSTIEKEASVVGTLRASGYTRSEMVRHYLILPVMITLIAAIIGNVLGYSCMKEIVVSMYYASYSLPTYTTIWNTDAFVSTTVIPCLIIFIVDFVILHTALSLPPLQFLRHELQRKKKKRVTKLKRGKFITRFRIRIILQNIPAYLTLFIGIMLASVLLIFGMVMSPLIDHFKVEVKDSLISEYQYILKAPVETKNKDAEKYCVNSLNIPDGESITIYGISENSKYLSDIDLPENQNEVIVTDGYMEKYNLQTGDTIKLVKKYEDKEYQFKIVGHYYYAAALAVFMPTSNFNDTFEMENDYFSGYFSDDEITDIDDLYIASVIRSNDLTVLTDQLEDSMGSMFPLISVFSAVLYVLLMYILAKLVIEKNTASISMIKILGYSNREAGRLYNSSTAIVVLFSILINIPISYLVMRVLYYIFIKELNGWVNFYVAPWIYPAMFLIGVVCYFAVHFILMKKVRKIPMTNALKNIE